MSPSPANLPSSAPEPLKIESCNFGSVRVLSVSGEVDLGTERQLERAIREAVETEAVVVDLHGVRFFAASGLGMLLRCRRMGMAYGHPVLVASPHRQFLRLVSAAKLSRHLPCFASLGVACARARQIDRARNPQPRAPAG